MKDLICWKSQFDNNAVTGKGRNFPVHAAKAYRGDERYGSTHSFGPRRRRVDNTTVFIFYDTISN